MSAENLQFIFLGIMLAVFGYIVFIKGRKPKAKRKPVKRSTHERRASWR